MEKYNKNTFLKILVLITALFIATVTAGFSIFGISKLFSAYFIPVIVMGIAIEMGKLVLISFTYQRWKFLNWIYKGISILLITITMAVTSIGIYGFLSSAYETTAHELSMENSQLDLKEKRKTKFLTEINQYESQINIQNQRVSQLINIRLQQEQRLNQLYNDSSYRSARRTENIINESDIKIDSANTKINFLSEKISSLNDSIFNLDQSSVLLQSSSTADLGPLKYMSRLIDSGMDKIINWFILIILIILDPVAIYLLIGFNHLILYNDPEKKEKLVKLKKNPYIKLKKFFKRQPKITPKEELIQKWEESEVLDNIMGSTSSNLDFLKPNEEQIIPEIIKEPEPIIKEEVKIEPISNIPEPIKIESTTEEHSVNDLFEEYKKTKTPIVKETPKEDSDDHIHSAGGIRP